MGLFSVRSDQLGLYAVSAALGVVAALLAIALSGCAALSKQTTPPAHEPEMGGILFTTPLSAEADSANLIIYHHDDVYERVAWSKLEVVNGWVRFTLQRPDPEGFFGAVVFYPGGESVPVPARENVVWEVTGGR
ncbi:MAG: hypothetical protein GWO44_18230 [Thermoplasmata archaeon]|nr:hypothetical protein [Thermoplasmata archaeon]NIY05137.1 hypothetical protein [Thermoplasmata archaeon]